MSSSLTNRNDSTIGDIDEHSSIHGRAAGGASSARTARRGGQSSPASPASASACWRSPARHGAPSVRSSAPARPPVVCRTNCRATEVSPPTDVAHAPRCERRRRRSAGRTTPTSNAEASTAPGSVRATTQPPQPATRHPRPVHARRCPQRSAQLVDLRRRAVEVPAQAARDSPTSTLRRRRGRRRRSPRRSRRRGSSRRARGGRGRGSSDRRWRRGRRARRRAAVRRPPRRRLARRRGRRSPTRRGSGHRPRSTSHRATSDGGSGTGTISSDRQSRCRPLPSTPQIEASWSSSPVGTPRAACSAA